MIMKSIYNINSPTDPFLEQWYAARASKHPDGAWSAYQSIKWTNQGEELVRMYLKKHHPDIQWTYSDPYRDYLVIYEENDKNYVGCADITGGNIKVEVKEKDDRFWLAFGEQEFNWYLDTNFHDADTVIVINSSHTKIAELDLSSRYQKDNRIYYKILKTKEL